MTLEDMRSEFRKIRHAAVRGFHFRTGDDWMIQVRAQLARMGVGGDPTPQQWLSAARNVQVPCRRCAGTGNFITRVENGKPQGPGGPCFRCNGKGYQTEADWRRNYGYDMNRPVYL